mgnify:CR=1 FL=1
MQTSDNEKMNEVIRFALISIAWSWVWWIPRILSTYEVITLNPILDVLLGLIGALGPGLAAVYMLNRTEGRASLGAFFKQGWSLRFNALLLAPAVMIMPVIGVIAGLFLQVTGTENPWQYSLLALTGYPPVLTVAALLAGAIGQEIGWRGFLQQRLQGFLNPLRTSLVLGVIWAAWQLPLHFVYGTLQSVMPVFHIVLQSVALSILFTWLYNKSGGSTLVAALFQFSISLCGVLFPVWAGILTIWIYLILIVLAIVGLGMAVGVYNYRRKSQL